MHRAAAATVPEVAAAAERERLTSVLHDVAAHRLTSIVVAAGAAARLSDPDLAAQAVRLAAVEGRRVLAELDRLAEADRSPLALAEVDEIAAGFAGVDFRRTIEDAPSDVVAVVYRVVLEALTNAVRHASGARVGVLVDGDADGVTVTVADGGGSPAVVGIGSGRGLVGLRSAVTGCGGTFQAGPDGAGWVVRARLPIAPPASRNRRPPLDWVSVLPAAATSIGFQLVSDERPDPLWSVLPSLALVAVLMAHAVSVGFRRRLPEWSLAAALGAFLVWLGFDLQSRPPGTPALGTFPGQRGVADLLGDHPQPAARRRVVASVFHAKATTAHPPRPPDRRAGPPGPFRPLLSHRSPVTTLALAGRLATTLRRRARRTTTIGLTRPVHTPPARARHPDHSGHAGQTSRSRMPSSPAITHTAT